MSEYTPFSFDTGFFRPEVACAEDPDQQVRFSQHDLDKACRDAVDTALSSEGAARREATTRQLSDLARQIAEIAKHQQAFCASLKSDARKAVARLALAIGRKLAGSAMERFGEDAVLDFVSEAFCTSGGEGRLVVKIPQRFHEGIQAHFTPLLQAQGQNSDAGIVLVPVDSDGDWCVEWDKGGLVMRAGEIDREIAALVEAIAGDASASMPPSAEGVREGSDPA